MQLTAPHTTRADTGRWVEVPGYLAPIENARERRAHRANLRGKGLAEQRLEAGEPSAHQLASLVTHAVAVAIAGDPEGTVARALARALRTTAEMEGWVMDATLQERVATRMRLDVDELAYVQATAKGDVTSAERQAVVTTMRERRIHNCAFDLARRRGESVASLVSRMLDDADD